MVHDGREAAAARAGPDPPLGSRLALRRVCLFGEAQTGYVDQLAQIGAIASMSRTKCCYNDAPMESFFHTLKVELVRQRRWTTHDDAKRDLFAYVEGYYNRIPARRSAHRHRKCRSADASV